MKRGLFNLFFVPQIVFGGGGDSGGGSSGGSSDSGSSSGGSSSSKKQEPPKFKSLAAAAKAGYHGEAVNIGGKVQKVAFADKAYDKRMQKASNKKRESVAATKNKNPNVAGQYSANTSTSSSSSANTSNTSSSAATSSNADTSASAKVNKPVKKVPPLDGGKNKPNFLGYGYYNNQGVWIPPDIDMQDGGGPGISGEVFGSKGGVQADTNNDGYVTAAEAKAAADQGIFKYGIGRVSNAVGATPFGSGRAPTGIAGTIAGGGIIGSALGMEYTPRDQMFGPGQSMTQEQVDAYMADVRARQQQAVADQQQLILHGSPADGGSGGAAPVSTVAETLVPEPVATTPPNFTGDVTQVAAYDPISYNPVQGGGQNPQIVPYPYPYAYGFGTLPVGNYQQPNLFAQLPPPVTQGIGSLGGII